MSWVIGADEVGRGPLAGPIYTAAVLVEKPTSGPWPVVGVRDSKKLTPEKRAILADQLQDCGKIYFSIASRAAHQIDSKGLSPVLGECFRECIQNALGHARQMGWDVRGVMVDGEPLWQPFHLVGSDGPPVTFIRQGDAKEWAIGAASILAKESRDAWMRSVALLHPMYGWSQNMGYGTADHEAAIAKHGLTPQHRRSFCKKFIGDEGGAFDMFSDGV